MYADQRILRGVAATLSWQNVDSDGTAAAPAGAVTVRVQQADGTDLLAAGTATDGTTSDPRTVDLTAAQTATLDLLTVTWSDAGDSSTHTTYVEIVGGYYFSVDDARSADASLVDGGKYTADDIVAARREVEDEFETICGVAFVPRYRRVTLSGTGSTRLLLDDPVIRTVRSVRSYSDWGAASYTELSTDELADIQYDDVGVLTGATWVYGTRNLVVEYEHGYDRPPAEIKRAAITRLRARLNMARSGIPDRATSFVSSDGGTFRLDTPGMYKTGQPEVDAVLARYSLRIPSIA